jgi:hypothetical protein
MSCTGQGRENVKEGKTPRKLKVDIDELISAMDDASYEHNYYLDVKTGRILLVTNETRSQLEEIYEAAPDEQSDEEFDLESSLEQLDLPDWQKDALREADEVKEGFGDRYISIPQVDSDEAYGDMEQFIVTVTEERLRARLWQAIDGRHPFRRFKDVLADYPSERERWFDFQDVRIGERVIEWLEDEGIELIPE